LADVRGRIEEALRIDEPHVERRISDFIREKLEGAGARGLVVGLSGGLDSSVCAALCVRAVGAERVLGLFLPEGGFTEPGDRDDILHLARMLGMEVREIDISGVLRALKEAIVDFDSGARLANANLRPRVRMALLYYYANLQGRLVVGASNKTELRIGYFTKFGDGAADLLPIGCLYKTQVRSLARHLGIPEGIIAKVPTAGLWPGQTDEGEIGVSYDVLDRVLVGEELGFSVSEISSALGVSASEVERILGMIERARHKLLPPPVPRL
jgi:NAD+ synthase